MKKVSPFLLFVLFVTTLQGQEEAIYQKEKIDHHLHGYWISAESVDASVELTYKHEHQVYHFKENDTTDIIINGRVRRSFPAGAYHINDTLYISFHGATGSSPRYIKRAFIAMSWKEDTLAVATKNRKNSDAPNDIFYRFKGELIPQKLYAQRLVGRTFAREGWIDCGEKYSRVGGYLNYFVTDSTYIQTKISQTKKWTNDEVITTHDTVRMGTYPYTIEGNILRMEYFEKRRKVMISRPVRIRQLLGLKKNRLIIDNMKEVF